jgi:hypothetical protein
MLLCQLLLKDRVSYMPATFHLHVIAVSSTSN